MIVTGRVSDGMRGGRDRSFLQSDLRSNYVTGIEFTSGAWVLNTCFGFPFKGQAHCSSSLPGRPRVNLVAVLPKYMVYIV